MRFDRTIKAEYVVRGSHPFLVRCDGCGKPINSGERYMEIVLEDSGPAFTDATDVTKHYRILVLTHERCREAAEAKAA